MDTAIGWLKKIGIFSNLLKLNVRPNRQNYFTGRPNRPAHTSTGCCQHRCKRTNSLITFNIIPGIYSLTCVFQGKGGYFTQMPCISDKSKERIVLGIKRSWGLIVRNPRMYYHHIYIRITCPFRPIHRPIFSNWTNETI